MMNTTFKQGDVVVLKSSNNPVMTVQTVLEDGNCECVWIDLKRNPKSNIYPSVVLKIYKNPAGVFSL